MSSLRVVTSALAALALGCLALLVAVLASGPVAATAAAPDIAGSTLTLGVAVDGVRAVLLVLVTGVAAVVAAYSRRNLAGQQRIGRYAVLLAAVVAGLALAVASASLPLLLLGWTTAGLAMAALVAHTGTDVARAAARSVRRRLLLGDAVLLLAVGVAGLGLGAWDVAALAPAAVDAPALAALAATLVVVAGAVRSALVPAHRWLPEVAEAPSPVSALLHAGFVNGIGLLALLLWPLVGASAVARGLALVLGVLSVVVATMQLRVRPDVKGRLVSSTSSQMGYLAVTLGLGLPAAALVHVLGHGMWKAGLFLGAGGAVERARAARAAHASGSRSSRIAAAALALATVLLAAVVPLGSASSLLTMPAYLLPVAVAALAAAVAARSASARPAAMAGVLGAAAAYVVGVRVLDHALEVAFGWSSPAWGEPGAVLLAVLVGALVALGAGLVLVDGRARRGALPGLVRRVARTTLVGPRTAPRVAVPSIGAAGPAGPSADVVSEAAEVAQRAVAPSWPLTSFVASNPLAGLEHLDFADALEVARSTWGARAGVDAALLRASLADGAADERALARIAASVSPGPDLLLAGGVRERAGLVAAALVADEPSEADIAWARSALGARSFAAARRRVVSSPAEAAADGRPELVALDERGRSLVSSYAAQQYGAPAWPTAGAGVWAAVRGDAAHLDRLLGTTGAGAAVRCLPAEPAAVVALVAARCGLAGEHLVPAFSRVLARDPGWVAHLAWRRRLGLANGVDEVVDLLAARLTMELLVVAAAGQHAPLVREVEDDLAPTVALLARASGAPLASIVPAATAELLDVAQALHEHGLELLRLRVLEESYRSPLVADLARNAAAPAAAEDVRAQVVLCIDVRSERLRRHLEPLGPWETVGAAGFFGLPLAHVSDAGAVSERLPALLRPQRTVAEISSESLLRDAGDAVHAVEGAAAAPFALAEAAGWVTGPASLVHTCAPSVWDRVRRPQQPARGQILLERCDAAPEAFDVDELVEAAAAFLRTTGLLHPAPVVLLVGHGGHAANNPHVAAYDCGACGGFAGDVNARAMAQVLNDPQVRDGLAARGIDVPEGTWFGAGLHDTTRDVVDLLVEVPDEHAGVVSRLLADLSAACDATAVERAALLPEQLPQDVGALRRALSARAVDWAQVRPEWGLARNAALVIGPRSLTSGLDLDGRVFLHSYRHDLDADGSALEFLLSAPMVVAQWISTQYWCSTVDPERFGAGDKTTHNVLVSADGAPAPLAAVVTGARGDLRIGLPWQSVSATAPVDGRWTGRPFHEPLRLLAVVHAEASAVDRVLARRPEVARLVLGEWVSLVVLEPGSGRALRYDAAAGWVPVDGGPEREDAEVGGR